ncbi:hypothetical protein [Alteromonas macleodii]|uniref:Uncharacterized protein n=1 Tax=Alteromonas macleodii TaxID=28108 RepID=A0AB36FMR5_ALTMA|nr:hypothetical protein [Alteromonas macleodii]OES24473.1 hypothetical protein BFV95_4740 [Alteromonas macleodii]OES25530.1 hypothetical protein BFV94_4383 [Alteromonas macleodii]OES25831.1 hypothetical protein BFV93_4294 [Alteromonas macleodii]OES38647.1 hypothetical protein BFV96_4758 [Alteromonas macleodii]
MISYDELTATIEAVKAMPAMEHIVFHEQDGYWPVQFILFFPVIIFTLLSLICLTSSWKRFARIFGAISSIVVALFSAVLPIYMMLPVTLTDSELAKINTLRSVTHLAPVSHDDYLSRNGMAEDVDAAIREHQALTQLKARLHAIGLDNVTDAQLHAMRVTLSENQ